MDVDGDLHLNLSSVIVTYVTIIVDGLLHRIMSDYVRVNSGEYHTDYACSLWIRTLLFDPLEFNRLLVLPTE